jgi:hypothetical protein
MADEVFEKGLLYGLRMPSSYKTLEEQSVRTINEELKDYPNALKMFQVLQTDPETNNYLSLANYIAVQKLGYNDHGPICERSEAPQDHPREQGAPLGFHNGSWDVRGRRPSHRDNGRLHARHR